MTVIPGEGKSVDSLQQPAAAHTSASLRRIWLCARMPSTYIRTQWRSAARTIPSPSLKTLARHVARYKMRRGGATGNESDLAIAVGTFGGDSG